MTSRNSFLFVLLMVSSLSVSAQYFDWKMVDSGKDASFRAVSVVDDSVAWVGGTRGWIGKTVNGGRTWSFSQVPGFEDKDFRSLYAHDARHAVIANAGFPANILVTNDGGLNWFTVFTLRDSAAFIDGVDFWNRNEGIIYGDPMQGRMFLMRTFDGGVTWEAVSDEARPVLNEGEASFAASGTTIRCAGKGSVVIATGGRTSRLWFSSDKGLTWKNSAVPILQGESTLGIFSVALSGKKDMVVVGGDYKRDTLRLDHVLLSKDAGKTWIRPQYPTRGYRECVEFIDTRLLIATGPTGTEVSFDGGNSWRAESDERLFHVVRKARRGNLIVIAGGNGKIAVLKRK